MFITTAEVLPKLLLLVSLRFQIFLSEVGSLGESPFTPWGKTLFIPVTRIVKGYSNKQKEAFPTP